MKKRIRAFMVFLFVFGFGCVPVLDRRVVVTPETGVAPVPLFSQEFIDEKMGFLNRVLAEEDLTERDRQMASSLLETYKSINNISVGRFEEAECQKLVRSLLKNMGVLDEYYFSKQEALARTYSKAISLFVKKRKEIRDTYTSGDFKGTINHCLELKAIFGPDALTPEISLMFALSLAKKRMLTESQSVIEGIVTELDTGPDLNNLRANLAELQLQLGEREKAVQQYKKLTIILQEQDAVLQDLNRRFRELPKEDTDLQAPSPWQADQTTPELRQHEHELITPPEESIDQILYEVDQLVRERRFGEAWDVLVLKRGTVSSETELNMIDHALKRLEQAQEEYLEETITMISKKKKTLQTAQKFIEEEKYEEAIMSLDALWKYEESHEIQKLREQATEKLINRERNRAAKLFLAAKKTQEPVKQEEYLRSSYNILKALIDKYPTSPLIKKIKSHIQKVEKELEKLGKKEESLSAIKNHVT
jgi:hypothetical protein